MGPPAKGNRTHRGNYGINIRGAAVEEFDEVVLLAFKSALGYSFGYGFGYATLHILGVLTFPTGFTTKKAKERMQAVRKMHGCSNPKR